MGRDGRGCHRLSLAWGGVPADAGLTVRDYLVREAGLPGWLAGQVESVARRIGAVLPWLRGSVRGC